MHPLRVPLDLISFGQTDTSSSEGTLCQIIGIGIVNEVHAMPRFFVKVQNVERQNVG
jgi:hypothetical protein